MKGLAPTRMNLLRARRRLERVERGTELLRHKREALVGEVFRHARPAADTRATIEALARDAWPVLLAALAGHGFGELRALGWPLRDLVLELHATQVWGVPVADVTSRPPLRRSLAARGTAPGPTGPAAAEAATRFERLADALLEAAPREMLIRRLGEALGQTSRQVHTLERRLAPSLETDIVRMHRQLDEREREEHFRLKRLLSRRRPQGARASGRAR